MVGDGGEEVEKQIIGRRSQLILDIKEKSNQYFQSKYKQNS